MAPKPDEEKLDARPLAPQGKRLGALALAMIAMGTLVVLASDLFFKYWPSPLSRTPARVGEGNAGSSARETGIAGSMPSSGIGQRADRTENFIEKPNNRVVSGGADAKPSFEGGQQARQFSKVDDRPTLASNIDATLLPSLAVNKAKQMLKAGQITAARNLLLQPAFAESREAAWLIARSFDPNYLATLQSPDAEADRGKAEEWYRRWHDIGAQNGLITDEGSLKQLIDTMH